MAGTNSPKSTNITWHKGMVSRQDRQRRLGQRGATIWFTGLSGSGKSTLSRAVEKRIYDLGGLAFVLDGDNMRFGLSKDLGFSAEDREENIRRVGEVAKLFTEAGFFALTAFISPYRRGRDEARIKMQPGDFIEVRVECALEVCEARDPKGLYKKARMGLIKDFTGITAPYEPPLYPEITVHTDKESVEECTERIISYLQENGYFFFDKKA